VSSGVRCWDASGNVVFDTTYASWFVLRDDITLNSNASGSYSLPQAAGMTIMVIESALYDALAVGFGLGTFLACWHSVSVDTSLGYPVVTLSVFQTYNIAAGTVATPMQVHILGRYT